MKLKLLFALLISTLGFSQIWVNSLDDAKKMAKATNKLVIIDFNATWCKPCRLMESEFWYNAAYKPVLDKFVVVQVDIDNNKDVARQYSVNSIPNVKVIDLNGEVIHETLGYESASSSLKELEGFPESVGFHYENLNFKDKKNPTDEEVLTLANSYQYLLQKSNGYAKKDFYGLSNYYFNKCLKKTNNPNYKELSDLGKYFNSTLIDVNKKVIKDLDITKVSDQNKSFAYYILAKANFQEKNIAEGNKYISEIEKTNDEQWTNAAKVLKLKYSN